MKPIRRRTWEILEAGKANDPLSRLFDISILALIFINVLAVILETVDEIRAATGYLFPIIETLSVAVFGSEYLARLWSCVEAPAYKHPVKGRLRAALHPLMIIDLLAILPAFLGFFGIDLRFMRAFRLFRVFKIVKFGRYNKAVKMMVAVGRSKKEELLLTTTLMTLLLIVAACLMYYCENPVQPEAFPSIPAAMWWAIITLTTVGYGDVYPVTLLGRLFAALFAVLGIGLFALPTGILGAAFVEEIQSKKNRLRRCPHCGEDLEKQP